MIQHYRQMVDDPIRIEAFARAIAATVREGDVVLDAGCGLGTYAILACRAGASRVYAVESTPIIDAARELAAHNGCADRIVFLSGRTDELVPPERARVVIFEDYQSGFFVPGTLAVVRDLCTRWLAPYGALVPNRARLWAAPVQDADGHGIIDRLRSRRELIAGVDLSPTRSRAFASLHTRRLSGHALLSAPTSFAMLDLARLEPSLALACSTELEIMRAGTCHGVLVWFELELAGTWLDTGPTAPPSQWAQTFLPLATPIEVTAGQRVPLKLDAAPFGDAPLWRWSVGAATGSTLAGMYLQKEGLALSRPDRIVTVNEAVDVDRYVLSLIDGTRHMSEIVAAVQEEFPAQFSDATHAHRRVAQLLARYL